MKALSIQPPWPWLILKGIKPVENRTWCCAHRGPLLIHASKGWDQAGYEWILREMNMYDIARFPDKEDHIFGAIQGRVIMTDCVRTHPSPWFFGKYGFIFKDPVSFYEPIPYKGRLGLFDVPDEIWNPGNRMLFHN